MHLEPTRVLKQTIEYCIMNDLKIYLFSKENLVKQDYIEKNKLINLKCYILTQRKDTLREYLSIINKRNVENITRIRPFLNVCNGFYHTFPKF